MKHLSALILTCALAIPAFAQDSMTNTPASNSSTNIVLLPAIASFSATNAVLTAPMVLTNGCLNLDSDQMESTNVGKAVFSFTVTNSGDYVLEAMVNAPDDASNSFFLNMDAMPDDEMIWDMDVTTDFEKRIVSWRGNGDGNNDEISPKRFKLEPGVHQIIITGREPGTLLKSISVHPAPPA